LTPTARSLVRDFHDVHLSRHPDFASFSKEPWSHLNSRDRLTTSMLSEEFSVGHQFADDIDSSIALSRELPENISLGYDQAGTTHAMPLPNFGVWGPAWQSSEYDPDQYLSAQSEEQQREISSAASSPMFTTSVSALEVIRCDECNQEFHGTYRRGNMNRHRRQKHQTQSSYPCADPNCPRVFGRQDARLKHQRRHHPELGNQAPISRRMAPSI
jgi:hypothetical protein